MYPVSQHRQNSEGGKHFETTFTDVEDNDQLQPSKHVGNGTLVVKGTSPSTEVKYSASGFFPGGYWHELSVLIKLAWPMIMIQFTQFLIGPMALIYCGHLDKYNLDAVALANSLINVSVLNTGMGLATACDTLFSQTFGGDNKFKMGVCFQKSLIIITLSVFPIWAIHLNAEAIFLAVGQDPEISRTAARYLLIFMPGTLAFLVYMSLVKFLQAQDILIPNVAIGIVVNLWNALAHYLLVNVAGYETDGSAAAQASSHILMMSLTLVYILVARAYKHVWEGWTWDCLLEWNEFAKLAFFGFWLMGIEFWSFEAGIFIAGTLGVVDLGAQTIVYQFESMWFTIPFGTATAASIRVGHFLGSGSPQSARASGWVAFSIAWFVSIIAAVLFASLRNYFPYIYTNDPDVLNLAAKLMPVLAAFSWIDASGATGAGILRGCGKQNLCTAVVAVGFAVALSVGIPLVFKYRQIIIFWYSLCAAMTIETIFFIAFVVKTNWNKEVEKAHERIGTKPDAAEQMGITEGVSKPHYGATQIPHPENRPLLNGFASGRDAEGRGLLPRRLLTVFLIFSTFLIGLAVRINTDNVYSFGDADGMDDVTAFSTWQTTTLYSAYTNASDYSTSLALD